MIIIDYDRISAINYAKTWAKARNPEYYDFSTIGGDCTNYVSQCVYAGCKTMNYTPITGWYYVSLNNRTASWTSVEYFYNFIVKNKGLGPFGKLINFNELQIGDVVQLGDEYGDFFHAPFVCGFNGNTPLFSAHSRDVYGVPISFFRYNTLRCIQITGVRVQN